ncbi:hypothetical protein ACWF99_23715 [Nocardia sp. NPDC055002]
MRKFPALTEMKASTLGVGDTYFRIANGRVDGPLRVERVRLDTSYSVPYLVIVFSRIGGGSGRSTVSAESYVYRVS